MNVKDMVNVCNDKMGQPYEKCKRAFKKAEKKCKKKMKVLKFSCKVVSVSKHLCQVARVGELLCRITSYIKNTAVKAIEKRTCVG